MNTGIPQAPLGDFMAKNPRNTEIAPRYKGCQKIPAIAERSPPMSI